MKLLKSLLIAMLVILVLLQFYRPPLNESGPQAFAEFEIETQPSDEVKAILRKACYDCHSNHTRYPWYNNVAPVSYWLDLHIDEGKEHLNFSDWSSFKAKKKDHKLEEIVQEVKKGKMPLKEYTWTHGDARLSDQERQALIHWAEGLRPKYSRIPSPEKERRQQLSRR